MVLSAHELDPTNSALNGELPNTAPDQLPDIASLDLSQLLHTTHVSGNRTPVSADTSRAIARFVTEKAEGELSNDEFDEVFSKAVGMLLGDIVLHEQSEPADLNDRLFDLYDVLDAEHPRTMELLGRVRQESNFSEDHKISLNKLCMLVTSVRFGYVL